MWDNATTVSTVVTHSHKKAAQYINITIEFGDGENQVPLDEIVPRAKTRKPKEKATYAMIQDYIAVKYGFKVHTAYIAEVKRSLGLPMFDAPNAVSELKQPRQHPTEKQVKAIHDAFAYYNIISFNYQPI